MAGCVAKGVSSAELAMSPFVPGSLTSPKGRCSSNAGSSARIEQLGRAIRRQRSLRVPRVCCSSARAGMGHTPDKEKSSSRFLSEDWQYLGKLFAGCTAGAVVIKYGSILLPQITQQPSLSLSLLIITVPVVASVVVLSAASSSGPPPEQ